MAKSAKSHCPTVTAIIYFTDCILSGKRGRRYLKRQQLLELGEPAIRYLTEIVHRRPRQWYEDVDRLCFFGKPA
jgi:hypothetical protein